MAPLEATYTDQANSASSRSFVHELPEVTEASSTEDRTAYLAALRTETVKLQHQINTFLTQKMDQDKTIAMKNGKGGVDDAKEEENYGEEVVEDDG